MVFFLQIRPDMTPCQWLHDIERNNGPGRQFRCRTDKQLHKNMLKSKSESPYRTQSLHIKVAALADDMLEISSAVASNHRTDHVINFCCYSLNPVSQQEFPYFPHNKVQRQRHQERNKEMLPEIFNR